MRRGVTLLELLVSLTLLGGVLLIGITLLGGTRRALQRSSRGLELGQGPERAALFLQLELESAAASQLELLSPQSLGFPHSVGDVPLCANSPGILRFARSAWWGSRLPEAGRDQALLLDPVTGTWKQSGVTSVTGALCPDGTSALQLSLAQPWSGGYLRVVEPLQLKLYSSGGSAWFGLAPANGTSPVQPFAGPLAPGTSHLSLSGQTVTLLGVTASGTDFQTQALAGNH